MFKNKKFIWVIIILILVLAAGGYAAYTYWWKPAETEVVETSQVQTAVALFYT